MVTAYVSRRPSRASWLDAYAHRLFQARSEHEIAEALLAATCALVPRGGAVYRDGQRIAATGSGLALPRADDRVSDSHLRFASDALTLVADAAPHIHGSATAKLLTDVVDLAATTLEALDQRALMRERLRTLAQRVGGGADPA
ncbi:MAG: hypothetical protein NVS9B6_17900 [Candidatus Limnocylindrales bacterium]